MSDTKAAYKKKNSRAAALAGLAIAGTGVSHFTSPQLFEPVTKSAFPRDTRRHLYTNGGIETASDSASAPARPGRWRSSADRLWRLSGRQRRSPPVGPSQPLALPAW